jgi:hypothetical protein
MLSVTTDPNSMVVKEDNVSYNDMVVTSAGRPRPDYSWTVSASIGGPPHRKGHSGISGRRRSCSANQIHSRGMVKAT